MNEFDSVISKLEYYPTKNKVITTLKGIKKIDFFKPQTKPNSYKLQIKVNAILRAFHIDFKVDVEIKTLTKPGDWAAARAAAWAAARAAAWDAARDAALDAAWDAARDAALDAARGAARDAALDAAWAAAWDAAWDAVLDAAWAAARAAAWDAAWDAARAAAWDVVSDIMPGKGWKRNPYKLLMDLWKHGFYVCGVTQDKKFLLYYVPKRRKK